MFIFYSIQCFFFFFLTRFSWSPWRPCAHSSWNTVLRSIIARSTYWRMACMINPCPRTKARSRGWKNSFLTATSAPDERERVGSGHLCTGLHCESCTIRVPAQRPRELFCICFSKYICYFWVSNFIVYISGKEFTMFLSCTLKHFWWCLTFRVW